MRLNQLLSPTEPCIRCALALAACEALCSLAEELPELLSDSEALLSTLFSATVLPPHGPKYIFLHNWQAGSLAL